MTAEHDESDLQPGQSFGSYEIVRLLGRGAFGAVYEALRMPLKKRTALKVLHREYVRHREVVDRFVREAEIVAQLDHPHIVDVFDVGVAEGAPFLAMEFLDGESLSSLLEREGPLQVTQVVDLMLPVLSAVAVVHDKGIVHRDLKPDNLFIARLALGGVQPKLLDFGIAKVRDAEKALTRTNAVMGTPFYMSPEQVLESKHIDAQADQWSLAVILFECLSGKKPFDGDSLIALLNAITSKPIPTIRTQRADIPEAFEAIILRAMEREPAARWPSMRAFGAALVPYASPATQQQWRAFFGEPVAAPFVARVSTVPPAAPVYSKEALAQTGVNTSGTLEPATRSSIGLADRRRQKFTVAAGAVALAALIAVGGWASTRGSQTDHAGPTPHAVVAQPAEASVEPAPTVADAGAPTAIADAAMLAVPIPVETASPTVAATPAAATTGRPSRSRRVPRVARPGSAGAADTNVRNGRAAPSAQACPNGICAPD
jgi:serine/threonine-protein kinase